MKREELEKIALEKSNPCVTISMNTHRTHPGNAEDVIVLKNLLKEAFARVTGEFSKEPIDNLVRNIINLEREIDFNHNLNSLHVFLSETTKEIVKSPWSTPHNRVHISGKFAIRPLIKLYNRTEEYLILMLTKADAKLFRAVDGDITQEIENENFPFINDSEDNFRAENRRDKLIVTERDNNVLHQYLNRIDKALVGIHNKTGLNCVVICTDDNYSNLKKVADKPGIYLGHVTINYKESANHNLSAAAWQTVRALQERQRGDAIAEMQEAFGHGKVVTGLKDIFKAVKEGRGELLITNDGFHQAVRLTGDSSIKVINDEIEQDVIDDITSEIAWEVMSKKGRVIFTDQNELNSTGEIALKIRY